MPRPVVQIAAPNRIALLRSHLAALLPRFILLDGLVGITLNGGMSRGYADHLSEIDLTLYLTPEAYAARGAMMPSLPAGITVLNGQLYDLKYVDYAAELAEDWDDVKLWDASYAEILYERDNLLLQLLAGKLAAPPEPAAAEGLLMSCWWYYALAGEIWIARGDPLQGHHMLHQAVVALVKALFVANREYIPHEKWLLHLSRTLAWQPHDWAARLAAAMSTGDLTVASLQARKQVIHQLWADVDSYIIATYFPTLPVHMMQKTMYEQLVLLAASGSMAAADWYAATGGGVPASDPFYPVIGLEHDHLCFNHAAALRVQPEEMYAWHYAILQAVLTSISPP